jgi:transcriptional regulator GlxA family with amidase domain
MALLTGPQGTTVRQIGLADSRLAHLARAIRWIRGHYNETLRVEKLAALATLSASSFHRHFPRGHLDDADSVPEADPPARDTRATPRRTGDVTGVGFAVGYDSPSQFGREYRRMFGVPPSRDALALREAAVLPSV